MNVKVEEKVVGLSEGQQEGSLVCRHCGREYPVTLAVINSCLKQGWRKCCHMPMQWVIPQEEVDRDQE